MWQGQLSSQLRVQAPHQSDYCQRECVEGTVIYKVAAVKGNWLQAPPWTLTSHFRSSLFSNPSHITITLQKQRESSEVRCQSGWCSARLTAAYLRTKVLVVLYHFSPKRHHSPHGWHHQTLLCFLSPKFKHNSDITASTDTTVANPGKGDTLVLEFPVRQNWHTKRHHSPHGWHQQTFLCFLSPKL